MTAVAPTGPVAAGLIVPGLPHPLLTPDANPGYARLRAGFDTLAERIRRSDADLLLVYSTMWPSVIGHQIQAHPQPQWVHVDELFHHLGSIPYRFRMDPGFGADWVAAARRRGLHARTVAYDGFPIDTGSVVALKLLDPEGRLPATIVSSNVYADRAETTVLAKAARDALQAGARRAVVICVTTLSNRLFTDWVAPADDHIHSPKDDEWNLKVLEFLGAGRLEDTTQLSREIHAQVRVKKVVSFKPLWFLSALMGEHNRYDGDVLAYGALHGTGAAVVSLVPAASGMGDKEFDEEDVEQWHGERSVLEGAISEAPPASQPTIQVDRRAVATDTAPTPVGAYPHARREGEFIYVSGMGPRQPGTGEIPGGPIVDAAGLPRDYDIAAQTRAVIENIRHVLVAAGSGLEAIIDVTVFLVNMQRDFPGFNRVYAELLGPIGPTRTTVAVSALPTPIAVELKVVARVVAPG